MKRLFSPVVNSLVFVMLFGVIGYYVVDPGRWLLVSLIALRRKRRLMGDRNCRARWRVSR